MPPMRPICESRMTRSGVDSWTAGRTSSPRVSSRTLIEGSGRAAITASRTLGESLTTRTSGIAGG